MNRDRARYEAGVQIAKEGKVHWVEGLSDCYVVESQPNDIRKRYLVSGLQFQCSCPDKYAEPVQYLCKHAYAVVFFKGAHVAQAAEPLNDAQRVAHAAGLDVLFGRG